MPLTTVPTDPVVTPLVAEERAGEWLTVLRAGDVEGAYERLDDTSRDRMSFADFELLGAGLFEGAAAFAGPEVTASVQQVEGDAAGVVSVVTFSGDVEREGMIETDSYPVIITGSGVHFTLNGPELELDSEYADSSGTTLASPMRLLVGGGASTWLWFDGGEPERTTESGQVTIDVEAAAGPGTHLVSMLSIRGELITARAWTVVVP